MFFNITNTLNFVNFDNFVTNLIYTWLISYFGGYFMKYKNRLIIPTLLSTSLIASSMVARADEMETEEQSF